jgi:hypothetical protein
MKSHPHPAALTAPLIVQIAPGQILWACLAPGSILHTTQGEVAIRSAPRIHGHTMDSHPQAVLKAGTPWQPTEHHQATWVQLGSATRGPAEIKIVESARQQPGWRQKAWRQLLRRIFADRRNASKNRTPGAWHAAQ